MNTTSATSLTSLYRDLNLSAASSQQELRASNGNLYLKEGKALVSVESRRLAHQEAAIQQVLTAMTREYGLSGEEASSLLRSVQADSSKVTVADVRQLHNELTLGARHKSERSQELQQVSDLRKQQLASASSAQGLAPNTRTHEQLRGAITQQHGAQTLALLDEKLPSFMHTKGLLTPRHIETIGQLLHSDEVARFQKAITMVTLNANSPVDSQAARAVAIELARLPISLLNQADAEGLTVRVTHDNVTTYHTHLAGTGARGHDHGGWDQLPGVGAFGGSKETVIAMEQDGSGKWRVGTHHGSANLVLHEFGHSVDRLVGSSTTGTNLSKDNAFYAAWYQDYNKLGDDYFKQAGPIGDYEPGLEESFAEGLARLYGGNNAFAHWDHIEAELLKL
jgi:hypothetical protein